VQYHRQGAMRMIVSYGLSSLKFFSFFTGGQRYVSQFDKPRDMMWKVIHGLFANFGNVFHQTTDRNKNTRELNRSSYSNENVKLVHLILFTRQTPLLLLLLFFITPIDSTYISHSIKYNTKWEIWTTCLQHSNKKETIKHIPGNKIM